MATRLDAKGLARGAFLGARARVKLQSNIAGIIEKLLPASRNRAMKAAGIAAGWQWVVSALPLRFSAFAQTRLGYDSKKMHKVLKGERARLAARALMRENGDQKRVVTAATAGKYAGWDPYGPNGSTRPVFTAWLKDALDRKLIAMTDPPQWGLIRSRMRADVKTELSLEDRLNARANEIVRTMSGELRPVPLVDTGWLQRTAPSRAYPTARNTQGGDGLSITITIPRGNRVHPIVTKTLQRVTGEEVNMVGEIVRDRFAAFIGDAIATNRSGKPLSTGKPGAKPKPVKYMALNARSNRIAERLINSGMNASQRKTYEGHNKRGKK